MIKLKNWENCCGCTACASICNHGAITMHPDAMGFCYPQVDVSKCIDCHLCEKVCAFNDFYDTSPNLSEPEFYGGRHKNTSEVEKSRSGAVFVALSDWILQYGGVVYGAGYAEHFRVVHKRVTTMVERDEFRGSKYVQSDLGDVYRKVRSDLKAGLVVMFTGTPCQIAGLASFIGPALRENLYLVDIICHGVQGPNVWRDYLAYLERIQSDRIVMANFRDKQRFGWSAHEESYKFSGGKILYTHLFYQQVLLRPSCGICHFANIRRPSDITLGDFWGWEKTDPNFNKDDKGASLIIVNTDKGRRLFETIRKQLHIIPAIQEHCLQPNLCHPTPPHPKSKQLAKDYARIGFERTLKKYGYIGWKHRLKEMVIHFRPFVARIIKRTLSI